MNEAERSLEEARAVLRKMGPIARDLPQRAQLQMRIRAYDSDLQRLEKSLLVAVPTPGARAGGVEELESTQRGKLVSGLERVDRTGARLEHTEVVSAETEAIGVGVITDLHGQREVLEGVDGKLSVVDDNTTRARRILINMARRIATNKLILALIIFVQIVTIFFIIFFKWIYPHIPKPAPTSGW